MLDSFKSAVTLAIANHNSLANIDVVRWAETYSVTPDQVIAEWNRQTGDEEMDALIDQAFELGETLAGARP